MGGDMQGLELLKPVKPGCRAAQAIAQAIADNPDQAEAIQAAATDPNVLNTSFHEFLNLNGYRVGKDTVRLHRAGACGCDR